MTTPQHDPPHTHDQVVSVSFYMTRSERDRARAAYRHTAVDDRIETWSEFISRAVRLRVEELESDRNAGTPFATCDEPLRPGRRARRMFTENAERDVAQPEA
ncbi:hypothetical protein GCM10027406_29270 [Leifsonia lichenia]